MLTICHQLFRVTSVRYYRSGIVPLPVELSKDIERWRNIHRHQIHELLKKNQVSEATTYFYREVKNPDRNIYSLLLGPIGRTGHTRLAFRLFRDMRARNIRPSPTILTSLFNSCANNDEDRQFALDKARSLYEQVHIKGWTLGDVTYHAMMKAFAMQGDGETCFKLLDEMSARKHAVTVETYNHLLMGCIADKEIGFLLAIRVMRLMLWKRIRPNSKTFDYLLRAAYECGCGNDVQLLNRLLEDARRTELNDPNVAMITSGENLLDVRLHNQLVAVAKVPTTPEERLLLVGGPTGIFAQMSYFKIQTTPVTCSYLLKFYSDEEKLMEFVKSLDQTQLDTGFWNQLLKKCIISNYSCIHEVIRIINDQKIKKDNITYGILAMAAQTEEQVKELIAEMEKKKFAINEVIMSTLVNNMARRFKSSVLADLFKYCEQNEIALNQMALRSIAICLDRARYSTVSNTIAKFLKRIRTTPSDELTRSRLKQFEPLVWKRDRRRWDPEASEAELQSLEKGTTVDTDESDMFAGLRKDVEYVKTAKNINKK